MTDPVGTTKKIMCPDCDGQGCPDCNSTGRIEATVVKNG